MCEERADLLNRYCLEHRVSSFKIPVSSSAELIYRFSYAEVHKRKHRYKIAPVNIGLVGKLLVHTSARRKTQMDRFLSLDR